MYIIKCFSSPLNVCYLNRIYSKSFSMVFFFARNSQTNIKRMHRYTEKKQQLFKQRIENKFVKLKLFTTTNLKRKKKIKKNCIYIPLLNKNKKFQKVAHKEKNFFLFFCLDECRFRLCIWCYFIHGCGFM